MSGISFPYIKYFVECQISYWVFFVGLLTVPFLENVNKFQNPFHRPVATTVFLIGTAVALSLGIGATLAIDKSLTLGIFLN